LQKLMDTRDKLSDLMSKADLSEDLEGVLEKVLQSTDDMKKLSEELGVGSEATDKEE